VARVPAAVSISGKEHLGDLDELLGLADGGDGLRDGERLASVLRGGLHGEETAEDGCQIAAVCRQHGAEQFYGRVVALAG
jgi:hypothetical protein